MCSLKNKPQSIFSVHTLLYNRTNYSHVWAASTFGKLPDFGRFFLYSITVYMYVYTMKNFYYIFMDLMKASKKENMQFPLFTRQYL